MCLKCLSLDLQLYKRGDADSQAFETLYLNEGEVLQKLQTELAGEVKEV